jgi:hypothetical protein
MNFALTALASCLCAFVLSSCATPHDSPRVQFSGVTESDVREIQTLILHRTDILKPLVRVDLMSTRRVKVISGRYSHVGDTFDEFTVSKRNGTWVIVSPIQRDSIVVTAD